MGAAGALQKEGRWLFLPPSGQRLSLCLSLRLSLAHLILREIRVVRQSRQRRRLSAQQLVLLEVREEHVRALLLHEDVERRRGCRRRDRCLAGVGVGGAVSVSRAVLVGAEQMKLGFVSRTHPRDPNAHVVLNTQTYKTKDFAQQINLKETNMWGSLKLFLDTCRKFDDGTFICVKDPSKNILRFYKYEEKSSVF